MVSQSRRIVHIDMDAFYASVEQREAPDLRGQPVAVGGRPEGRGVVAAASYEARAFGVHSAMSMTKAIRLCPELKIVRPNFKKYRSISQQVFAMFRAVTPLVEPLSLDEAYLDVTENAWEEPLATPVARRLKQQIADETGLTASAGVAPNKFLAKVASGWRKPDGLTVVPHERIEAFLQELPVGALWGVGPVTARRLRANGIERVVDMRTTEDTVLRQLVGKRAEWLKRLSYGEDDRPVTPNRTAKSAGSERTYPKDLADLDTIRDELERLTRQAASKLDRTARFAHTVTVKMRYSDFTTITRSHTTQPPTRDPELLAERIEALLEKTEAGSRPVRLLGVSVANLTATDRREHPSHPEEPRLWDE